MKKLSKAQEKEKAEHAQKIRDAAGALEGAIDQFNKELERQRADVQAAQTKLNEAIADAESWRDEINTAQGDFFEDKSERWQEGEAGSKYSSWKEAWAEEFEQVEIELPDDIQAEWYDVAELLENLPDEAD